MRRGLRALTATVMGAGLVFGFTGAAQAQADRPVVAGAEFGTDALAPAVSKLRRGEHSRTWQVEDYINVWEQTNGRAMGNREREHLARGCIGVSVVNIERSGAMPNPQLSLSFSTFEQARRVQQAIAQIMVGNPGYQEFKNRANAHPLLSQLQRVSDIYPREVSINETTPVVFSKRFYSKQNPNWSDEQAESAFLPNRNGQVNMLGYNYMAKPGYVNFDYGWYDARTDSWWHANHAEPDMKIYQSTLAHYSRPLLDFDRQVFTVVLATNPA